MSTKLNNKLKRIDHKYLLLEISIYKRFIEFLPNTVKKTLNTDLKKINKLKQLEVRLCQKNEN